MLVDVKLSLTKPTIHRLEVLEQLGRLRGDLRLLNRVRAIIALSKDFSKAVIADILGVSAESIRLWFHAFLLYGPDGLKGKTSSGRKPRLTKTQKTELKQIIVDGPQKAGFPGGCWRSPMIQDLIQHKFGVLYSAFYISQLLRNMGLSFHKGRFVSDHLDPQKRKEWLERTWPAVYQLAQKTGASVFFGDEASFPQWGSLGYTWGIRGHQTEIPTSGKRKAYKVFGLIEFFSGQAWFKGHDGRLNSETYTAFLQDVLSKVKGPIILIQDGAKYHTSAFCKAFFKLNQHRLLVVQLPAYSPDYNPIEQLWKNIKEKGIHMVYFPTFEALTQKVQEMMGLFENAQEDVLRLFQSYRELNEFHHAYGE